MEYCPKLRSSLTVFERLDFQLDGIAPFPMKTDTKIDFSAKNYLDTMSFGPDLTFQATLPSVALRRRASYLLQPKVAHYSIFGVFLSGRTAERPAGRNGAMSRYVTLYQIPIHIANFSLKLGGSTQFCELSSISRSVCRQIARNIANQKSTLCHAMSPCCHAVSCYGVLS